MAKQNDDDKKTTVSDSEQKRLDAQAEAQAAQNREDAEQPVPESARTNAERAADHPDSKDRSLPSSDRVPTVGVPEERSFNERTSSTQPFILPDGTQDNGARDLNRNDGSKGESSRLGNNSVREDTKQAIKDGVIPASDEPDIHEKPVRNPVK